VRIPSAERFPLGAALTQTVKPFQCPHCTKAFVEASNLTKHIRTHTGERMSPPHPPPIGYNPLSFRQNLLRLQLAQFPVFLFSIFLLSRSLPLHLLRLRQTLRSPGPARTTPRRARAEGGKGRGERRVWRRRSFGIGLDGDWIG
jgi:hypothetical protein